MKESSSYQAIMEEGRQKGRQEGRVEESRKILLMLGITKLGPLSANTLRVLADIDDLARLHALIDRLGTVKSWPALLAETPSERE